MTQLESDCDLFIELDTFLFINNFTCTGLQGCFNLIKLLNNTGDIPRFVLSQGTPAYKDTEIAEAFKDYFCTVYQPNKTSTIDFSDKELNHVSFGRQEIENGLANASLGSGVDKLRALSYGMQQPRYLFMYIYCSVLFVFILATGNFPMFHLCSNTVTLLPSPHIDQ